MYRLILYDTEIYTEPEKTVDAYGVVSEVKQKEKTVEITLAKVDIRIMKNFLYILNHLIILKSDRK